MKVRLFLLWAAVTLGIACLGFNLSAGSPWGVDDGVKRLAARSFAASGGTSTVLPAVFAARQVEGFFPLPPPFVEPCRGGYRSIFPASWLVLGGLGYAGFGTFWFYLLPASAWAALMLFLYRLLRRYFPRREAIWADFLISSALLFYGLTFLEHGLSLLLLLPLFRWMGAGDRAGFYAGAGLGAAAALRPETALLLPLLWLLPLRVKSIRYRRVLEISIAMAATLAAAAALERLYNGRWFPLQTPVNLDLWFSGGVARRLQDTAALLLNAPLPPLLYALFLVIIFVVFLKVRSPLWLSLGTSTLALLALLWGIHRFGFFGVTAYSQGLFFAFPWVALGMLKVADEPVSGDPYWIIGWGYLVLAYILGPDRAGMHWGARFLFPAVIPLVIRSLRVLRNERAVSRRVAMIGLGLASAAFAGAGVGAAAQRGAATGRVIEALQSAPIEDLVVTRWHEGADLEPLWGKMDLFWVDAQGDAEEWLIRYARESSPGMVVCLNVTGSVHWEELPLAVTARHPLPRRGGWGGEWLELRLRLDDNARWGRVYWHAAIRRVERGDLNEAKRMFVEAVERLPEDADLRYDYAVCLGRAGEVSSALQQLEEALRLNPNHAPAEKLWRRLGLR